MLHNYYLKHFKVLSSKSKKQIPFSEKFENIVNLYTVLDYYNAIDT